MVQRIQTLFLLAVAGLIGSFFVAPYASFMVDSTPSAYYLDAFGLNMGEGASGNISHIWAAFILIVLVLLVDVVTVFLYKKRVVQIRLCILNIVMLLGLQGMIWYIADYQQECLNASIQYGLVFIFPLIAAILTFLALRAIARDEALVRSLDRLR